jgi:hypothetical protein
MAEPEWDEETRNLALGLDGVDLCPLCGLPSYLCQDPELQFKWRVPQPTRCHVTTAKLAAQASVSEETNPQSAALLWGIELGGSRG